MFKRIFWLGILLAASAVWSACDEKLSSLAGPTPSLTPTFSSIQRDILESSDGAGRLACTQCHSTAVSPNLRGGMILDHDVAYDTLVNVPSRFRPGAVRVIPGDPDNSYLIRKLEGGPNISGLRMPRTPPYLTDGQLLIIRRWIAIGAPRN